MQVTKQRASNLFGFRRNDCAIIRKRGSHGRRTNLQRDGLYKRSSNQDKMNSSKQTSDTCFSESLRKEIWGILLQRKVKKMNQNKCRTLPVVEKNVKGGNWSGQDL
jgi:hypothetical protein